MAVTQNLLQARLDNYISPKDLTPALHDQLRSAFEVVTTLQKELVQRFTSVCSRI